MKNICFVCPSLHQGGLENAVMVMSNEMATRGHQVSIICVYNNPVFYQLDERIKIISPTYKRKDFSTVVYYLKSIFYLTRIKKRKFNLTFINRKTYQNMHKNLITNLKKYNSKS
jgi:hypothetical protein